uniref:Uncharacterized protein n=1 Tax=Panagrolaimus davidi TaxID=227884 RepID=A0A914P1X7_9BILA
MILNVYGPELLLNATEKDDFVKQIKNIEKIRRRRERRQTGGAGTEDNDEEMDEDVQSTFTTADTVKADTIFDILEDTDDEEEKEKRPKETVGVNVFLNENDDEIIDLLDRDTYIQKLSTKEKTNEKRVKIETPKKDDTFQMAKDGRIVIVNIDKKRKRYNSEMFEDNNEDARKNRDDEENDEVIMEQQEDNRTVVASTYKPGGAGIHRTTIVSNTYKPGGSGIHRSMAHSQAMSYVSNAAQSSSGGGKKQKRSDDKKKGDKFEPYAYVPLRNKGRKNGLKSILKKNVKGKKASNKKSK